MGARLERHVDEAFDDFARRVEELAQSAAGTEAVLYGATKSDEWKRNARFEYELSYEITYWERVQRLIEQHLASRKAMRDEQVERRLAKWDEEGG